MAQHPPSIPGVPTSAACRCNRYEPIARRMSLKSRDNFFFATFPIQGFPGNLEPIPIDRCTCEWLRSHAAKLLRIHCVRTCTNDVVAPKRSQSNRVRSIIAHASGFATIAAKLLHIRRVYSVKRGCWNIGLSNLAPTPIDPSTCEWLRSSGCKAPTHLPRPRHEQPMLLLRDAADRTCISGTAVNIVGITTCPWGTLQGMQAAVLKTLYGL